jgi:predicted RNase H-like nuclease (RuvC/YqgF family)
LVSEPNSLKRAQSLGEKMSKTNEHGKIPPPPLDEDGNPNVVENGSNTETSTTPTVKELMKKLEKLNVELKKLKTKGKKDKKYCCSSEDDDDSFEEEVSNKARWERKRRDKSSYNAMSFSYDNMTTSTAYTSVPVRKTPFFYGSN